MTKYLFLFLLFLLLTSCIKDICPNEDKSLIQVISLNDVERIVYVNINNNHDTIYHFEFEKDTILYFLAEPGFIKTEFYYFDSLDQKFFNIETNYIHECDHIKKYVGFELH